LSALAISLLAAALMLAGAGTGILLRRRLPHHHLNEHSKDVVRLGASLVATITALLLGLLITSAKTTYETQRSEVRQIASKIVLLDNQLKRYGPEANAAREAQRRAIAPLIDRIWGERAVRSGTGAPYQPSVEGDMVYEAIENLNPQNDNQRNLKYRALSTVTGVTEARVRLFEESEAAMPNVLIAVVMLWLTLLFASFTLFSPINPTGAVVLTVIAVSASAAIFLVLELNQPFSGLLQISPAPLRDALGSLGS
jgi:Protein of unknown function (DUF4239)